MVKKRKLILTESNETYTECSRLQINDMWHCAKQFWKKMYTGWVMSIERQGNQGSTIPPTPCVIPCPMYSFLCYFTKTRSKFIMILMTPETLQCTPILTCYMINCFWFLSTPFLNNAIALPVLKFIFKWAYMYTDAFLTTGVVCLQIQWVGKWNHMYP